MLGGADRFGGEQAADVLDHDELWLQGLDRCRHLRPQAGASARCEASTLAYRAHVLTRKTSAEDVHRGHVVPVDRSDVAEFMPETSGQSLEELEQKFSKGSLR